MELTYVRGQAPFSVQLLEVLALLPKGASPLSSAVSSIKDLAEQRYYP